MRRISSIAGRQHGVITRTQLLAEGWSESRIDREVRAGRLHRLQAGVYALGHRPSTDAARWLAAVLACGDGAVLARHSAGALLGLPVSDNGLTRVAVPSDRRRPRIDTHRALLAPEDVTVRHRIPVTSVARTLADLAHSLDDARYHRVVKEAQFRGLWDDAQIEDALTRRPATRLRAYLGDETLTQSELEDAFLRLCRRHGIPLPDTQFGTKPRVDFVWHAERLVVEVDGWEAHRTRAAFQDDRTNTNALQLGGFVVLRYTHQDVTRRDRLVAQQVLYAGNFSSTHSGPSGVRRYGRPPTRT
jgi:very-short-patch-repair endonuclease